MKKTFGEVKVGDIIYLVSKTTGVKGFKIRKAIVRKVNQDDKYHSIIDFLNYEIVPLKTQTSKPSNSLLTKSYIKAFTTIEEAREDYKLRLLAEISDISRKINEETRKLFDLENSLRNAAVFERYIETDAK